MFYINDLTENRMMKNLEIKKIMLSWILILSTLVACQNPIIQEFTTDPASSNMKIIPVLPTVRDEIQLVIYDDCNYNSLSGITRNGKTIHVIKQFNSMMKWPCLIKNETINLGKLPAGGYVLNYKLLDFATAPPKAIVNLNFNLFVSQ